MGETFEGKFYIGRDYDAKKKKLTDRPLLYDPSDLTTHGVVVGMTGSGKTGLCVDILEEAALNSIPAILIDPKGDIANLLLHFPELEPSDFLPWIDEDEARKQGETPEAFAAKTASLWRKGLADWGIEPERVARVAGAASYAVYTPGSDAGIPVSILASLQAPGIDWEQDRELLREKISSTATALLGLVGIQADPVRSREHILLANIFEAAWKQGADLDLTELIKQIQSPPFEKLGAFEIEQFYPADDRFELAMALNSLLAAPSFEAWMEGVPLDIGALLWTPDGRPRQSVFYLAHLSDQERMFFVTLLLTAVETWMRSQEGVSALRALLYFDEVLGYLPPVANPPSKPPLMRLFKQARAFGLGVLLTTQNPVDLDYKALSNAGTWFIGKLQTEQDKARLLDGLQSLDSGAQGFDIRQIDDMISGLGKRVFLLHNVHEKGAQLFQTRWAMAYLKGPISKTQVGALNALAGADQGSLQAAQTPQPAAAAGKVEASTTKPAVPQGVAEVFLPNDETLSEALKAAALSEGQAEELGLIYSPALLAQALVRYLDAKKGLDHEQVVAALCAEPDQLGVVRWEDWRTEPVDAEALDTHPSPHARFADVELPWKDTRTVKALKKDFLDYVYREGGLKLLRNKTLKLLASPGATRAEFLEQCSQAARKGRDEEIEKLRRKYEKKIKAIQDKLEREERELAEDQAELSARKMEEMATHAENVLGLFTGSRSRRRVSSSLTKRRMTEKAKADVEESVDAIEDFKRDLQQMEEELREEIEAIEERWAEIAAEVDETIVTPYKKNIRLDAFAIAWVPYWRVRVGGVKRDLPATRAMPS